MKFLNWWILLSWNISKQVSYFKFSTCFGLIYQSKCFDPLTSSIKNTYSFFNWDYQKPNDFDFIRVYLNF